MRRAPRRARPPTPRRSAPSTPSCFATAARSATTPTARASPRALRPRAAGRARSTGSCCSAPAAPAPPWRTRCSRLGVAAAGRRRRRAERAEELAPRCATLGAGARRGARSRTSPATPHAPTAWSTRRPTGMAAHPGPPLARGLLHAGAVGGRGRLPPARDRAAARGPASAAAARSTAAAWPSSRPREAFELFTGRRARPRADAAPLRRPARPASEVARDDAVDRHRLPQRHARGQARRRRRAPASTASRSSRATSSPRRCRPARCARCAAELGPAIDLYQPFRDFEAVARPARAQPAPRRGEVRRHGGASAPTLLLVCSNVSPDAIDDDALAAEQLHALAERAAERGLRIAYEALAWGRHVDEYDHAWRIVRARRPPRARHLPGQLPHPLARHDRSSDRGRSRARRSSSFSSPTRRSWPWTCSSGAGTTAASPARAASTSPASWRACSTRATRGPLSLEVFNDVFRQADPDAHGDRRDALAARCLEDALGAVAPLLTPARRSRGYAFAELAVEPDVGRRDRSACCTRSGFARAGHHRSKPVKLWRAGRRRACCSTRGAGRPRGRRRDRRGERRPGALAARAEALLRPDPRAATAGRARPTSPRSPRRTAPRCSSAAPTPRAAAGSHDFAPLEPAAARPRGAVDRHRPRRARRSPSTPSTRRSLFYRSVLGLEPHESLELAAPDGLVRSRAVTSADGSVRLALNVPRAAPATSPAGLQHIAFASRRRARRRRGMRRARRPAARDPGQLLRRPRRPARASSRPARRDARARRPLRPRRARRVPALLHAAGRRPPLLRGRPAPGRLRRLRRGQRAGPDGRPAAPRLATTSTRPEERP